MPDEQTQESAVEEVQEQVVEDSVDTVRQMEQAAEESHVELPEGPGHAALVGAMAQLAQHQADTNNLITQQNQLLQSNLNEFSRALSNVDISAQKAAEAAATTEAAITPEKETAPDKSEHPDDVSELPKKELASNRSKAWWFGKAAYRHGGKR